MSLMVAEDATDMGRARMSVVWWSRRLDVRLRALANGRRWPATAVALHAVRRKAWAGRRA